MPELPEVETTARYLSDKLVGETVTAVDILWQRSVHGGDAGAYQAALLGRAVSKVWRRGKFVVISLGKNGSENVGHVMFHLRMSGSLDVVSDQSPRDKHDRVVLSLSNGKSLRFHDPRKFGRTYHAHDLDGFFSHLGPEPLETSLKPAEFHALLTARDRPLKTLLLDQAFLAGVGNIYADEALWRARIHPLTRSGSLSRERCSSLLSAIRAVLKEAIKHQGTDNGDGVVTYGLYRPRVYGREDEPCRRCRSKIKRIVVGQRGTSFCPRCQPKKRGS